MELFESILKSILKGLYEDFWPSVVMAVLFMFAYRYIKTLGIRRTISLWIKKFIEDKEFRTTVFFVFYLFMILCRTVLGRAYWGSGIRNVIGTWGLYDSKGRLYTDGIENVILFIPFTILYFVRQRAIGKDTTGFFRLILKAGWLSFLFSVIIELTQLMLKLGAFQLSDIAYNTAGGVLGGIIISVVFAIQGRKKNPEGRINQ